MRKQTFCICENKNADQLRGYREADLRSAPLFSLHTPNDFSNAYTFVFVFS